MAEPDIRRFYRLYGLLAGLLLVALNAAQAQDNTDDYLVFGFLPIVSTERLAERFSPLVTYLSETLEVEIRMETAPDFAEFVRRTAEEKRYDILFTAPHLYYLAHRDRDYRAVARVDMPGMNAVIAVRRDSPIDTLEGLRGHSLATTGPLALATLLVSEQLTNAGLVPHRDLTLVSTPSHNASLLSAYRGTTDASALMLPVYRRLNPEVRDNMRIIAETRSVLHIPIAVAPWVDAAFTDRLRQQLIDLDDSAAGRTLLVRLGWPGFTPAQPRDYDSLKWIAEQMQVP